jgi:dCMP deaminase
MTTCLYLRQAYVVADEGSPDPSTRVGAIIRTTDNTIISGCNHLPPGMEDIDLSDRALKYKVIEHAERDVIYKAVRRGLCLQDATMYCPWAACCDCARAIVLSGIKEVVCHGNALDQTPDRWREDIELAKKILVGGGVKYTWWYGELGQCQNLFNGTYWNP